MFCENCGARIDVGQKFCASCGTPAKIIDTVDTGESQDYQQSDENRQQNYQQSYNQYSSGRSLSAKTTSIIAYVTFIGFFIAIIAGDREGAKFHINQSLVIGLFSFLSFVPYIGWIWGVFVLICWVLGLMYAINEEEKEVPLLGMIHIIK